MSDQDQNQFEENNELSDSDISSIFSEGEYEVKTASDQPENAPEISDASTPGDSVLSNKSPERSRVRLLLIVLLVLLAGSGGFYFLGLNEAPETIPRVTSKEGVSDPPATAAAKNLVSDGSSAPVVTVTPPPPPNEVSGPAGTALPENALTQSSSPKHADSSGNARQQKETVPINPETNGSASSPPMPVDAKKVQTTQSPLEQTVAGKPASTPLADRDESLLQKPQDSPLRPASGTYLLDAGSYLFESNRDALVTKIEKLGFKPLVTRVDASLNMTRVRVGTFEKQDVKNALERARAIEPGSYSAPAGNGYVIYAGTFLRKDTVEQLKEKFLAEGIKVHLEPVQVVRTLNRIRFGDFQTVDEARKTAQLAEDSGVKTIVVKR
jgi:cell division septation protein DedD